MKVIYVMRKPLSEGTITANVLKHGTGALNIDACRNRTSEKIENHSRSSSSAVSKGIYGDSKGQETHQTEGQKLGRWPANVIFQHLDGCRCDGVKKVGAGEGSFVGEGGEVCEAHEGYKRPNSSSYTHKQPGHRKTFGEETVARWTCEPGCPVARLDEQSGVTKGAVRQPTGKAVYPTDGVAVNWNSNSVIDNTVRGFGDTGGASRFYKQVGGKSDG